MDQTRSRARAQGYVETVFGRRLAAGDEGAARCAASGEPSAAIKRADAGTAADLIQVAMVAVQNFWSSESCARCSSCRCR